jgi:hypothetical protein
MGFRVGDGSGVSAVPEREGVYKLDNADQFFAAAKAQGYDAPNTALPPGDIFVVDVKGADGAEGIAYAATADAAAALKDQTVDFSTAGNIVAK